MSLSELCEGPATNELRAIPVLGETGTGGSRWFEFPERQIIVLDKRDNRVQVETPANLLAVYDQTNILIYERLPIRLLKVSQPGKFLVVTKAGLGYLGLLSRTKKPEQLALLQPGGELLLEERDIDWVARFKQSLPRA